VLDAGSPGGTSEVAALMRIAYDTTVLSSHRHSGVYIYTYCLLQALLEMDGTNTYQLVQHNAYSSRPFDYSQFASERVIPVLVGGAPSSSPQDAGTVHKLRGIYKLAPYVVNQPLLHELALRWQERAVRRALKADIVHASEYFFPRHRGRASVVTIHDITTVLFPQFHTRADIHIHQRKLAFARDHADAVIAVSEASKRDLVEHVNVPEQRIVVIPEAARPIFTELPPPGHRERMQATYGIARPYLLFVGSLEPRKNLERLLDAYAQVVAEGAAGDTMLVVVGARGWHDAGIVDRLRQERLASRVRWLGFIPDENLQDLYTGAECLVYPSLYEGFGLPILEAMASGCPVITSTTSSMPEVAGDAALLVDPQNTGEIAEALARLLRDETLRTHLATVGRQRTSQYSWRRVATDTLRIYETVG